MFDLPQEFVDNLRDAMTDEKIELPFPAPLVWWKNGDKRNKAQGGVLYHGGWAISADNLDTLNLDPPAGFKPETWTNREGNEFGVLAARSFGFAAIAKRRQWTQNEAGNWRSHVQILGVIGIYNKDTKGYDYYGPAVLSAKGYAGRSLEDALAKWNRDTQPMRKQYANGYPAWLFYAPLGSFGQEPNFVQWGGAQKSPGTPVQVWMPETITDQHLQQWFVGQSTAEAMSLYKTQTADWLAAWKQDNGKAAQQQPETPANIPPEDGDFPF
jgi:hypothetical protein